MLLDKCKTGLEHQRASASHIIPRSRSWEGALTFPAPIATHEPWNCYSKAGNCAEETGQTVAASTLQSRTCGRFAMMDYDGDNLVDSNSFATPFRKTLDPRGHV